MLASPLYFFIFALVAAVGVSAQTANACTLSCVQAALANSTCTSFTDLSCVCNSTSFQQAASKCLAANCTAADQQAALELQKQECGTSSSANVTSSQSSSSASSTSKPSSAAASIEQRPFLIAIAGVALWGAFAL